MVPRSSSVVVKRMPPARPGKGKAAMYIAAPGTSTPESKPNSQSASTSWPSRGSLSRRFDKEAPLKPAAVRAISPCFLLNSALTHATSRRLPPFKVWAARVTRRPRWPLCSRLSPQTGRRLRKKCHSWCRLWRFFPCPVVISLIHIRCPFHRGLFCLFFSPRSQSDPGLHQSTWNGYWWPRRQAIYASPPTGRSAAPA